MSNFSTTAKGNNNEGFEREPISEGLHAAKCVGVFGIGTHVNTYGNEVAQVVITWAVDETYENDKKEEVNKTISKFYNLTLGKKANLRKDLEKWRGKEFTEDDLEGFDVSKVLGAACLLDISNNEKDGKVRDKVDSVRSVDKKYKDDIPKVDALRECPEWIENIRSDSIESKGKPADAAQSTTKKADEQPTSMDEEYSEDLPF